MADEANNTWLAMPDLSQNLCDTDVCQTIALTDCFRRDRLPSSVPARAQRRPAMPC